MVAKNALIRACLLGSSFTTASAELILLEQFESDGDGGARYLSSAFNDNGDYFNRHDYAAQNPHPQQVNQTLFSVGGGVHMDWAWTLEDITDSNNPLGSAGPSILRLNDVDISNFVDVTVTIEVATVFNTTLFNNSFDTDDGLDIQIAFDANSGGTGGTANPTLLNGSYTTIGSFRGQGSILHPSLAPQEVSSGTVLSNRLQDFTFDVTGSGMLSLQILGLSLDGSEELIFDNIRIEGTMIPEPSAPLLLLVGLSLGLLKRRR